MRSHSHYQCFLCGNEDHFFFKWSTSRYFNRKKVLKLITEKDPSLRDYDKQFIMNGSYRVCGRCVQKYKLMER